MAIYHVVATDNRKMICGLTKGEVGPNFVSTTTALTMIEANYEDKICWKCSQGLGKVEVPGDDNG